MLFDGSCQLRCRHLSGDLRGDLYGMCRDGMVPLVTLKLKPKDMLFNYGAFPQTWEDPKHVSEDTGCPGDNVTRHQDNKTIRQLGHTESCCHSMCIYIFGYLRLRIPLRACDRANESAEISHEWSWSTTGSQNVSNGDLNGNVDWGSVGPAPATKDPVDVIELGSRQRPVGSITAVKTLACLSLFNIFEYCWEIERCQESVVLCPTICSPKWRQTW